jgi:hypothetical protein
LLPGKDFVVDFTSIPARISPIPGQRWPVGITGINTVAIFYTAGYQPPGSGNINVIDGAIWQALTGVTQSSYVLDSNGNVEVQLASGSTTGETEPTWPAIGSTVSDGIGIVPSVWKNYGPIKGRWTADTHYAAPVAIIDSSNNLQVLVVSTLTSGGTEPSSWQSAIGGITTDNSQPAWMCIGPNEAEGASDPANQITQVSFDISIPQNLYIAVLQLIVHWYQNRDVIIAGGAHTPLPMHLQSIIDLERVLDFTAPEP